MPHIINVYSTLKQLPAADFEHRILSARDRSDPELLSHLNGFIGFIFQGDRPMTYTRYHVMRHIERVQHHLCVELEEDALDAFSAWANRANMICFMSDSTVRDPEGLVLVDPETGQVEVNALIPFPRSSQERKARIQQQLEQRGIDVSSTLPPIIAEEEVELRPAAEVVGRAYALLAVALRGESLATNDPLPTEELKEKLPWAFAALSPREAEFFAETHPTQQATIDAAWRYESLYLLEWALGLVDELPFPDAICDVPLTARTLLQQDGELLADTGKLRATNEILDALDLTYRLHWRAREAQRNNEAPPGNLDRGVLQERHYALNWLVRFENAEWDNVDTPT